VGNIAITFGILADVLATIPTLVKAYRFPTTEANWPWLAISSNGFFTLLTIKYGILQMSHIHCIFLYLH